MDSLLSSLKDLLELKNAIKLTLPGLLGAIVLSAAFWPAKPIDIVPVVTLGEPLPKVPWGDGVGQYLRLAHVPRAKKSKCFVSEYNLNELPTGIRSLLPGYKSKAQSRQYALEQQKDNLEQCLANETRLAGEEQPANAVLQRELVALEALRDKDSALVAEYERKDEPMISSARGWGDDATRNIDILEKRIADNEQKTRDREWETVELARWQRVVADRLADPGRLRPELGFDEYMSALSSHVLAFIFLAVAVGMVTEAIITPGILETIESFVFGS